MHDEMRLSEEKRKQLDKVLDQVDAIPADDAAQALSNYDMMGETRRLNAALFTALAKARGEFPPIPRTRTATVRMKSGGTYSYNYADLADVFDAVIPALSAYGLAVSQSPMGDQIVTVLMHENGGTMQTTWPIKPMPMRNIDNAQDYQSVVQVAKRYALTAALGISTEETVEGDPKANRKRVMDERTAAEDAENPGLERHPRGAVIKESMTPREKAEECARAIMAEMQGVKTIKGVEGVWSRSARWIDALQEKHEDLWANIYEQYCSLTDEGEDE